MKARKILYVPVIFIVLLGMIISGCAPTTTQVAPTNVETKATEVPSTPTVNRGGTLTVARELEPLTFDPFIPGDNGSIYLLVQVLEPLVRADATGAGVEPCLAKSWDISADKLTYTFHLRDVKFSNGDPLTAADVEYSVNKAAKDSGLSFIFNPIDNIKVVDDKTVQFKLKLVYAPFLSSLSLFTSSIVPKAVHEKDPEGFGDKPIGTGPFMVEEYKRGEQVVLVKNPNYWGVGVDGKALPYLDKVIIKYVPEATTRILGFRNKDYDVLVSVPLNEADGVKAMEGVTLEVQPIYALNYVYLNHQNPPLDNRDFRLAINYATDRQAILKNVYFNYGEVPNSFMPKMNFWSKDVPLIPFDIAKAKELVGKSGYNGEVIDILVASGDTTQKQTATMMQQSLGEAGIKSTIRELDSGAIWDEVSNGTYMANVSGITSDINDDDELATLEADSSAPGDFHTFFSWYINDDVSKLLAQAREASDPATRAGFYKQVQQIVYYQDGYNVPINFVPYVNAYYNKVHGWRNLTVGWWWLKDVWVEK